MKKVLSIILSILILFGSVSVVAFAAEDDESYTEEEVNEASDAMNYFYVKGLPERFDCNIEGLKTYADGKYWNEINLLGMNLEFLYSADQPLLWSYRDIYKTDENGAFVYDEAGNRIELITRGDIALVLSSVNAYLKRLFYNTYGGLNLYTSENAVKLANALGNIFYRDFVELKVENFDEIFGNEIPNSNEFFEAVATLSKMDVLVQANWCSRGRAFCEPVVNLFGGTYSNVSADHYKDGKKLAAKFLEGFFAKMNIFGPVRTILDVVKAYCSSYELAYREPTLALFTHKTEKILNFETIEEYQTFSGLIKLMFCNCDPIVGEGCFASSVEDVEHFCPLEFPTQRIAVASDDDEIFMYLFYYFNLCGKHRNNAAYIEKLRGAIDASDDISDADKVKVKSILDGYFCNNIKSTTVDLVEPYLSERINEPSTGLFNRLKNSIMVLMKKIADYIDYLRKLISGDIDYGSGNSPFA